MRLWLQSFSKACELFAEVLSQIKQNVTNAR